MAQIVDTPKRRAFMASLGERGWLGMTWPKEYGGSEGEGVYEYLLNEQLARRGGPQIGKGVGIVGKTIIRHGNERLKAEFLPKILRNEVEFAVGYSEPNAGSDAASMQLKATKVDGGWILNGQKTWTTSAHFAEWYWVGAAPTPSPKHAGITLFLVPIDQPCITVNAIWTMGDERTNEVFLNDVFVPDDYVVGRWAAASSTSPRRSTSSASPCSPSRPSTSASRCSSSTCKTTVRDGVPLKDDPVIRQRLAQLATQLEVARVMGLKFVFESSQGWRGADGRGLRVQAVRHRALEAPGQRVHGHRRAGLASCGSRPRRRRWPGAPSPPTATRSSTPSAAGRRKSRRTSSPGASSDCRRTSDVARRALPSSGPSAGSPCWTSRRSGRRRAARACSLTTARSW